MIRAQLFYLVVIRMGDFNINCVDFVNLVEGIKENRVFCHQFCCTNPVSIYSLKVNKGNTKARCELCSELAIKTPKRPQWRGSGVFIVNFKHISHVVQLFLLLTSNM